MIEFFQSIDQSLFLAVNSWHFENLNKVMVFLSGQVLWVPLILGIITIGWKTLNRRQFSIFVLFLILTLIATDVTSSYIIKNLIQRLRPCRLEELRTLIYHFGQKCGGRFGFVSSHAGNSIALISFGVMSLGLNQKKYWPLWLLPLMVSYSRVYLGVHYPGDILGGFIVGLSWSFIFAKLFRINTYGASRTLVQP